MYPVSDKYKAAVYAPVRTAKGRVTFDISDVTAADDVNSITTPPEYILSNKQQLVNKRRETSGNFVTWEPNRFQLNGTFSFVDDNIENNGELGYCSEDLCDENGDFDPYQVITFTFNTYHSSMGVTITFDIWNNEYATDFTVTAYDENDNIIDQVEVTGNTDAQSTPLGQLYQYKKIEIVIKKWCKPFRRCRVTEVDFGVVRVYRDDSLIKMNLIEEMDLTSSKLPSPEFKFTVDSPNREFNILNPQGFYKYLQKRQQIMPEIGIETEIGMEYVPLGEFILWDWTSDEGALTASFTGRTVIDLMAEYEYENLVPKSNYSLYDMTVDIFTLCGIRYYRIDDRLRNIPTNGVVSKQNCKNILQMIALAGYANVFLNREGDLCLVISPLSMDEPVDTIDLDNMYKEAQIQLDKVVKSIIVTYYPDPDTPYEVTVSDPEIESGEVLRLEGNTLINTETQALNVANWLLRQKQYRAIHTMNWRGNPAHELGDVVVVDNTYGTIQKAIITKNDINYQGYLTAKTEAKGLVG